MPTNHLNENQQQIEKWKIKEETRPKTKNKKKYRILKWKKKREVEERTGKNHTRLRRSDWQYAIIYGYLYSIEILNQFCWSKSHTMCMFETSTKIYKIQNKNSLS